MDHALYRISSFKEAFRQSRPIEQETGEGHFNFSKYHALSHYADFIRKYGAADGYDTSHDEAKHKYMIQEFYDRTNKRETFQAQLIEHNERRLNILAMKDIVRHAGEQPHDKDINFIYIRAIRDPLDLKLLGITKILRNLLV